MELLPKTGYVQAQSSFSAQLKFLPRYGCVGTWVCRHVGTRVVGMWVHGYVGMWVHGYVGMWVHVYVGAPDMWVHQHVGTWVCGIVGVFVACGYLGFCVHGYKNARGCGCMGTRLRGYIEPGRFVFARV